jgi:oligosaccharyltransferase complex subunit alpha (ribophorin I)
MLREPLLLVGAFFLLFLLSIIYVRLDFAIAVDENAEAKMKVAGYCEKVAAHQVYRYCSYCGSGAGKESSGSATLATTLLLPCLF